MDRMKTKPNLSQDRIAKAALEMIDEQGETAFSMRKLAIKLQVDPMAIYHHHANKSALLHAVMQTMMEGFVVPKPSWNWQVDMRNLCVEIRNLALKHPGAFCIYETYNHRMSAEHKVHEAFYASLLAAGFAPRMAVQSMRILYAYSEAFAVDEISGWLDPDDRVELTQSLSQGPYPSMSSLIEEIAHSDPDADFEFGLNVLIKGLEAHLP
jgi:AcrR family transcriptional regulator